MTTPEALEAKLHAGIYAQIVFFTGRNKIIDSSPIYNECRNTLQFLNTYFPF